MGSESEYSLTIKQLNLIAKPANLFGGQMVFSQSRTKGVAWNLKRASAMAKT
jgi:hypothetical protein